MDRFFGGHVGVVIDTPDIVDSVDAVKTVLIILTMSIRLF